MTVAVTLCLGRGTHRVTTVVLCGPLLADELDDLRNQLGRHDHDGLPLGLKSRFVFGDLFVFGLTVVVLGELPDSLFIPPSGIRMFFFLVISVASAVVCEMLAWPWASGRTP